jgi:hypothetical protein
MVIVMRKQATARAEPWEIRSTDLPKGGGEAFERKVSFLSWISLLDSTTSRNEGSVGDTAFCPRRN